MRIKAYLAPMCGVTDIGYRQLCRNHAPVITCTEMVSAKALERNRKATLPLLLPEDGVQLVGNEPKVLANAAKRFPTAAFVELNAGCPVPKVAKKGQGAALLKDTELMRECVDAIIASTDVPVTVKTRIGWAKNTLKDTAQALKGAGLERVVVHARTATQNYGGEPNWKAINEATWLFDCPVTGNGGVNSYESAARMLEETNCEGVMVGRAAMTNPLIFKSIHDRKDFALSREQEAELFLEYASLAEGIPFFEIRAHALWLCGGFPGAPAVRRQITQAKSVEKAAALLRG